MNEEPWIAICRDLVHRHDRDRLMCSTVAPENCRPALLALLAFNLEIATIAELVGETSSRTAPPENQYPNPCGR